MSRSESSGASTLPAPPRKRNGEGLTRFFVFLVSLSFCLADSPSRPTEITPKQAALGQSADQGRVDSAKTERAAEGSMEGLEDLPARLVIRLRIDEARDHVEVLGAGLDRGAVLHPGKDPESRYVYFATTAEGAVVSGGRFDALLRSRPRDNASAMPDDVLRLSDRSLLIKLRYQDGIAAVKVARDLIAGNPQSRAPEGDTRPGKNLAQDPARGHPIKILTAIPIQPADLRFVMERSLAALRLSILNWPQTGDQLRFSATDAAETKVVEANFQVNSDTGETAQNEPSIAINPVNPANLVAGANDFKRMIVTPRGSFLADLGYYTSFDGGRTWAGGFITRPSEYKGGSDPAVAADNQGNFFYALIAFSDNPTNDNAVLVAKSTNGGRTFASPVPVIQHIRQTNAPQEDKEFIAVDNSTSRFRGNLYVSWTTFSLDTGQSSGIRFARSSDGARTFSPAIDLQVGASLQGSIPSVGPRGEVYVAWQRSNQQLVRRSVDGGSTFDLVRTMAFAQPIGTVDPVSRRRVLNGGFRVNNFPSIAVDAASGPNAGNVYLTYADGRNGDADVFFVRSTDGGTTWSPPVRINDDPLGNGKDQWFPWVTVDPTNGDVYVAFYDRRDDPDNLLLNVYMTRSTDGGQSFEPNIRVTTTTSDSGFDPVFGGSFVGDYIGIAASGQIAYPVWTDFRRKNADIFGAIVNFK